MARNLLVEIVAPNGAAFRGEATRFRAPGVQGSFEVLRGHAPMLAAVGVGTVQVTTADGQAVRFTTGGGFVEVLGDRVTMLADSAEPVAKIDVERARRAEAAARERIAQSGSPEERAAAEVDLQRARNRLRAAMGEV